MASSALPDAKDLLKLLQRAAEELKGSQQKTTAAEGRARSLEAELVKARAELASERARVIELKLRLDESGNTTLPPVNVRGPEVTNRGIPLKTSPMMKSPVREDRTNISGDAELLEKRVKGLEDEIGSLEGDRRAQRDRVKELEGLLTQARDELQQLTDETGRQTELGKRLSQTEHELAAAREQLVAEQAHNADALTRLQAWEARANELEASLQDVDATRKQSEELVAQNAELDAQLTTAHARVQALEGQLKSLEEGATTEQQRLIEATARVAQLETELTAVKVRRDELNVELSHAERARDDARVQVEKLQHAADEVRAEEGKLREALEKSAREAMDAEVARRAEVESAGTKEKEKHQLTAQRLLEARQRSRELEGQLEKMTARVATLEAQAEEARKGHEQALEAQALAYQQASHELAVRAQTLEQQLAHATSEWGHADRQYEQLHKEMIVILEQRDEARGELEQLKQRLGIRS